FLTRKPREGRPASGIVTKYRRELVDKITYWTGVRRPVVRGLVEAIAKNCERSKLWGEVGKEPAYLVELTAFGTTLALNFLQRGNVTGDRRRVRRVESKGQRAEGKGQRAEGRGQRAEGKDHAAVGPRGN